MMHYKNEYTYIHFMWNKYADVAIARKSHIVTNLLQRLYIFKKLGIYPIVLGQTWMKGDLCITKDFLKLSQPMALAVDV